MKYLVSILFFCVFISCAEWRFRTKVNMGLIDLDAPPPPEAKITGYDFRLFRGTPVWELTKAAVIQDIEKMKKIAQETKLDVDYLEPKFQETLLAMEVKNERYDSVKTLLELGADPNKHSLSVSDSYPPMLYAASVYDSEVLKLLLSHGGNPNIEGKRKVNNLVITHTPLFDASKCRLKNVKLLVEAGANIHFKNETGETSLTEALLLDNMDIVLYLLENGIEYRQQLGTSSGKNYNSNQEKYPIYIADKLRFNILPLNSEQYKQKMKVVAFLKKNGIDYRATPIPLGVYNEAKRLYPHNWEDYLDKY